MSGGYTITNPTEATESVKYALVLEMPMRPVTGSMTSAYLVSYIWYSPCMKY